MTNAYSVFCQIMADTRRNTVLYDYFDDVMLPPCDYSDLLRWQWIQSVSALDKLVHDLVRIGICQSRKGSRVQTKKFKSLPINVETLINMENDIISADSCFESFIVTKFKSVSYQDPDKIADGLSFIWNEEHKWEVIANHMGRLAQDVKKELKNIVFRRNQIAHEGDYVFLLGSRENMEKADVVEVMDFIEALGSAIYELVC